MYYENFLKRSDFSSIQAYITDGSELFEKEATNCISERISQCEEDIEAIISKNISDSQNLDDVLSDIFSRISIYESAAFESGFLSGAKLVLQAIDRLNKLS